MQATNFEFRQRFWIIAGIFMFAFLAYSFDHRNVVEAFLLWLTHRTGRNYATQSNVSLVLGLAALLIAAASAVRTWAAAYLRSEVVHDSHLHADVLVADGPYRYLRNPLYLGTILLAIGFGAGASATGFFVLVTGIVVFCYRLILREEAELSASQSESYRQYCARVPRLLPSLRPRVASSGKRPRWTQAFRGETMMWLFTLTMGAFAATLNGKVFEIFIAISLTLGFLISYSTRRRQTDLSARANRTPQLEKNLTANGADPRSRT